MSSKKYCLKLFVNFEFKKNLEIILENIVSLSMIFYES